MRLLLMFENFGSLANIRLCFFKRKEENMAKEKYKTGNHDKHTWFSCKSKPVDMLGHKNVKVYQSRFAFLEPKKGEKGNVYIDLFTVKEKQTEEIEEIEKQDETGTDYPKSKKKDKDSDKNPPSSIPVF